MARIHYGLAGEGRGHAVRARTLLEELQVAHTVTVHAPGDAYSFLAPLYAGNRRIEIREVPGLRWSYGRRGQVAVVRSARQSAAYLAALPGLIARLHRVLIDERAELVITDFEPALSRAARRAGVPLVAVDHQAFLTTSDLSELPVTLRAHAAFMGAFVARWTPRPDLRVVSSFYRPKLRAGVGADVRQANVFLRRALREAEPVRGNHVLAYLRPGVPECALDVLRRAPIEVRLYGRGEGPREGALVRRPVDEAGFLADLLNCTAVISTAGNQLIGEALALGKPVLAAPELGNREQELNAWFLARTPGGSATTFESFDRLAFEGLLERASRAERATSPAQVDGTLVALEAIRAGLALNRRNAKLRAPARHPLGTPIQ